MDHSNAFKSIDYSSPQTLRGLLAERGLAINPRYGQNFLINRGAREKLVSLLDLNDHDSVWEIGPGMGAMTALLAGKGSTLTVFEIDKGYIALLKELFGSCLKIIEGDFIKSCTPEVAADQPSLILGNLPYNAASAIILHLIENEIFPRRAVFTVQNEMADRMCAPTGTKDYSSFSILTQVYFEIRKEGKLLAGSFYPAPRVDSAIVVLEPSDRALKIRDRQLFSRFLKGLFLSRRKTLKNQLPGAYRLAGKELPQNGSWEMVLSQQGIDPGIRPEEISVEKMIVLINGLLALDG